MRRLLAIGAVGLALALVLAWLLRPDVGQAVPERTRVAPVVPEVVRTAPPAPIDLDEPLDPELLGDVVRGRHGLDLANRVCALCQSGALDDDACDRCPSDGPRARVWVDVVDENGRAFDSSDARASIRCKVGERHWTGADFEKGVTDVPAGDCTVSARRFQGPFTIQAEEIELRLEPGFEDHVEIQLPSGTFGGIGVTVARSGDGLVVESLVPGGAAAGIIPEGATIVGIGDRTLEELPRSPHSLASALLGPEGSEVEVTYEIDGPDGVVRETVLLDRRNYAGSGIGVGKGPAG